MSAESVLPPPSARGLAGRARRGVARYGWLGLAREALLRPLHPALAPLAARRLRRLADRARTVDELLALAYGFDAFGIAITPGQVESEIRSLLEIVRDERPRRILEIGTANGGSLFLLARTAPADARLISVDLPHGEFGGGYPAWKIPLYRAFTRDRQCLDLLRGDSHAPATVERVRELLAGEPLDLLFIDGDHAYAGVRRDFESYAPLVRPGGLVGFHDIAPPRDGAPPADGATLLGGDVPRYWAEIRARHPSRELVDAGGRGYFGIGLLRV